MKPKPEKRENEKTVLQNLIENKICFSVVRSSTELKNKPIEGFSRSYSLIMLRKDLTADIKKGWHGSYTHNSCIEYDLSKSDVIEFREKIDLFRIYQQNEFGRIYELKENSLKKHYDSRILEKKFLSQTAI